MEVTPEDQKEFLRACGQRLRERRLAIKDADGHSLTLEAAAAKIGLKRGKATWRKWETGSPPGAHTAVRVAEALGVTVPDIWGRARLPDVDAEVAEDEDDGTDDAPEAA